MTSTSVGVFFYITTTSWSSCGSLLKARCIPLESEGTYESLERNISLVLLKKRLNSSNKQMPNEFVFYKIYSGVIAIMKNNFATDILRGAGPRIKCILDDNGIKASTASEILGIELSHYYRMLNGERPMTLDNIMAHSEYLNVSILYLMFGFEGNKDKDKVLDPEEINCMMDMILESTLQLDNEVRKEKMLVILNVLIVLVKSMN